MEVNLDDKNTIRNAVSTGTMWRGLEVILRAATRATPGPSPSASAGVHRHACADQRARGGGRAGIQIPENANLIRNIMQLNLQVHDHLCTSTTCTR